MTVESVNAHYLFDVRKKTLEHSEILHEEFRLEEQERTAWFQSQLNLIRSLEQEAIRFNFSNKVRGEALKYEELMSQFQADERGRHLQNAMDLWALCQLLEERLTLVLENVKLFQQQYRATCLALARYPNAEEVRVSMMQRQQQQQQLHSSDEAIARALQEVEYQAGWPGSPYNDW